MRFVDGPRQAAVLSSVETAEVSSVRHLCRISSPPPQHFLRACLAGSQGGAVCAFPTEVLLTINVGKIQAFKKRDHLDDLSRVSVCVCVCVCWLVSVRRGRTPLSQVGVGLEALNARHSPLAPTLRVHLGCKPTLFPAALI